VLPLGSRLVSSQSFWGHVCLHTCSQMSALLYQNSQYVHVFFKGTFNPNEGLSNVTECLPCAPGMHCSKKGLGLPSGVCSPGFYCPPSQMSPTPELLICPLGHFCPTNSSVPLPCPPGSFMNHTMAETCYQCPPGW
jgi:hypothetical protein